VWDTISYKIQPDRKFVEEDTKTLFNASVVDSSSSMESMTLIISNKTTILNQSSIFTTTAGQMLLNTSIENTDVGDEVTATLQIVKNGETNVYKKVYVVRRGFSAGKYSLKLWMDEGLEQLGMFYTSLISILVAFVAGIGITNRFSGVNGGFVVAGILWFFALHNWLNMFVVSIVTLIVLGFWMRENR